MTRTLRLPRLSPLLLLTDDLIALALLVVRAARLLLPRPHHRHRTGAGPVAAASALRGPPLRFRQEQGGVGPVAASHRAVRAALKRKKGPHMGDS